MLKKDTIQSGNSSKASPTKGGLEGASSYHVHLNGIVQGVGFRPLVYNLAKEIQLNGYVQNGSDGLHIFFNADEEQADVFYRKIKQQAPAESKIISGKLEKTGNKTFTDFSIVVEENESKINVLISPGKALCNNCCNELNDKNNRRYRYPFITCTQCGPRYSIVESLPYERHNTAMNKFVMCNDCTNEYNNVIDRRFFSQTNSCESCGIKLQLYNASCLIPSGSSDEILGHIKIFLEQRKIIAVKGIGGYLLLCNANDPETIKALRKRKHRYAKPLAILYPNMETIKNDFELDKKEEDLLLSTESPIVLLQPKKEAQDHLAIKDIVPGLKRLGVMLPYSPLLHLIANDYGKPVIATSANISGSPIIYKDEDALEYLPGIADYLITCNRNIVIPQDDSVVQVSKHLQQQIILRRSRGYAPSFFYYKPEKKATVIATGAFLKSSFTLSVNENVFISQYLGSGESYESQQMYKNTLEHWLQLYKVNPGIIITDRHPDYFSHQYAIELAEKYKSEIKFIQHHEAHFAAALAENDLLHNEEPILGIIWDGTGLGNDGNIWGGEFFKYENNEMLRCYHFDYFPVIAGDKFALEPRIAALCAASDVWMEIELIKEKFTEAEWNNYQSLINNPKLFCSSAGRLFDAVASLLGLCDKQTYEGEATMYLQSLAEDYVEANGMNMDASYFKKDAHYYRIPVTTLMQGILMDIQKGKPKNYIAAKFHYSLVCLVDIIAQHLKIKKICFSGGVFQNALLVDWLQHAYNKKYRLYFHKNLSPNDENISFGQFVFYDNEIKSIKTNEQYNKPETKKLSVINS